MRVLGIDVGLRRIGMALSDATGLLASPWKTIDAGAGPADAADRITSAVAELEDDLDRIVVGHPRRLDGSPTDLTPYAEALARELGSRLARPVILQDERLTSHEAEALLAVREKDWRKRKAKLDAAAAAVVLQDYLDGTR